MIRVLFVDDEQSVLDGILNLLRRQRKIWHMEAVDGAARALAAMEAEPFDVVVSDMRMPVMDGAQLLEQVKERYPATVRIILSGQADMASVLRSLPVAHQFLGKPCDAQALQGVIDRVSRLQALLFDPSIRKLVVGMGRLPSAPETYWELTHAIADENCEITQIARIVEKDAAMSLKVLQLVSSAYFGRPREGCSIEQAVSLLGMELMRGLSLSSKVFEALDPSLAALFPLPEFQRRSLQTASLARRFAAGRGHAEDAFTAGLLHDVGRIVLAQRVPDLFRSVELEWRRTGRPAHEIERESIGATHAEVGAHLLGTWGIGIPIVEAVAYHHRPAECAAPNQTLAIVHAAAALVEDRQAALEGGPARDTLDVAFLEGAGFGDAVAGWRELAADLDPPEERAA